MSEEITIDESIADDSVDSSTTDNIDQQGQEFDENLEDNSEDSDNSEEGDDSQLPFHKHPSFVKRNEEWKATKEELKRIKEENKKLKEQASQTKEQPQTETPVDRESIEKSFEGIPQFEFKPIEEYQTVEDFYKDFRTAFMIDMMKVRENEEKTVEQENRALDDKINRVLASIESEDQRQSFLSYAHDFAQKGKASVTGDLLNDAYISWIKENGTAKQKEAVKNVSKMNKNTRSGASLKSQVTADSIRGKSMDDLVDEFMA